MSPSSVQALSVMMIAGIGIVVNGLTALLFWRGSNDLNIRAAFLHLIYDALVSVGVVVSAALLYWTGWLWIDPLVGLLIAVVILKGTWSLFSDSFRLIIDGVPRGISLKKVCELLESQIGVSGVHDLHVWALSTQENALSVHLWMPEGPLTDQARQELGRKLRKEHGIQHVTVQIEREKGYCDDACQSYL
jgi:cobalt-zinc-cadmium efflux system protein